MTDDLAKKLNTAGAFDSPWLVEQLRSWNVMAEQRKADFTEHMYRCSGRQDLDHPMHGLYTGLWHDFCIREAGPEMRNRYFEMLEAVRLYEEGQLTPVDPEKVMITA
jgi:hypothetical protein